MRLRIEEELGCVMLGTVFTQEHNRRAPLVGEVSGGFRCQPLVAG